MLVQTWTETFVISMQELWVGVITFLPILLGALLVFLIGLAVASVLGKAVTRLARMAQLDKLFEDLGITEYIKKAGISWEVSRFLGGLVKWFFVVVAFLAAVDLLRLEQLSSYVRDILFYLPNVIVAALILLVAALLASFLEKLVKGSLKAAEVGPARFVGAVVRWSVWGFAIIAALTQLGVATSILEIIVMGFVAMIALAGGLAFGLGGRDVARDVLENLRKDLSSK